MSPSPDSTAAASNPVSAFFADEERQEILALLRDADTVSGAGNGAASGCCGGSCCGATAAIDAATESDAADERTR